MTAKILNKGGDDYVYFTPESKSDTALLRGYEDGDGKMLAIPLKHLLKRT